MMALDRWPDGSGSLVAAPLLGLGCDIAAEYLICRLPGSLGPMRRQFISFGLGLAVALVVLALGVQRLRATPGDCLGYLLLNLGSYAFAGFCFFNLLNLNRSSLRIRMLKECLAAHPVPLSDAALKARYRVSDMLDVRLARLAAGGQIRELDGHFFSCRGITRWIGFFFAGLRMLVMKD